MTDINEYLFSGNFRVVEEGRLVTYGKHDVLGVVFREQPLSISLNTLPLYCLDNDMLFRNIVNKSTSDILYVFSKEFVLQIHIIDGSNINSIYKHLKNIEDVLNTRLYWCSYDVLVASKYYDIIWACYISTVKVNSDLLPVIFAADEISPIINTRVINTSFLTSIWNSVVSSYISYRLTNVFHKVNVYGGEIVINSQVFNYMYAIVPARVMLIYIAAFASMLSGKPSFMSEGIDAFLLGLVNDVYYVWDAANIRKSSIERKIFSNMPKESGLTRVTEVPLLDNFKVSTAVDQYV